MTRIPCSWSSAMAAGVVSLIGSEIPRMPIASLWDATQTTVWAPSCSSAECSARSSEIATSWSLRKLSFPTRIVFLPITAETPQPVVDRKSELAGMDRPVALAASTMGSCPGDARSWSQGRQPEPASRPRCRPPQRNTRVTRGLRRSQCSGLVGEQCVYLFRSLDGLGVLDENTGAGGRGPPRP